MTDIDKALYIADECERNNIDLAPTMELWVKIGYSLAELGEDARDIYHRIAAMSGKYRVKDTDKQFNRCLTHENKSDFGSLVYLAKKAGIKLPKDGTYTPQSPAAPKKIPPTPTPVFREIPPNWVEATICRHDALSNYLSQRLGAEAVDAARGLYKVGTTKQGETIFYLTDEDGRCFDGKVVEYSPDGHRLKDRPHKLDVDWLHRKLGWDKLPQTLCGVHLLHERPDAPVALVEAEKTALVGSIVMPDWLWVACGGEGGFTAEKLRPLQGRKVYIFPDVDAVEKWRKDAPKLLPAALFIGDWHIGHELGEKADLADLWLTGRHVPAKVAQLYPNHTALHRLCNDLGLDLVSIEPHTDEDEIGFVRWKPYERITWMDRLQTNTVVQVAGT